MMRIFISSVQKEFERERAELGEFIAGDALLRRQFTTFIFERDIPAEDRRADDVYLDELSTCDLYLGLFGNEYGWENEDGFSPTQLEFDSATRKGIPRLIYVHGANDETKHPKMRKLIRAAGEQVIRRRFETYDDLRANVYASLVNHLETTGIIHNTPWDATPAVKATLGDVDSSAVTRFVRDARKGRNFPLPEDAAPAEVLDKLHLLDAPHPSLAALLLFGKDPQRFLPASIVKCAHFHGTHVAKPIPAHIDIKGTAFELVNGAVDFVLSKIDASVGTREESAQAPVTYEIPREVIREAIVNAVAHRDYTSNASVQISLFADRLEIWNPGNLPPSLTLDQLRKEHRSFPRNLLFAEALYLARYIERYGTGTGDMIQRCREADLPEPDFQLTDGFVTVIYRPVRAHEAHDDPKSGLSRNQVTTQVATQVATQVTTQVKEILEALRAGPLSRADLQTCTGLKNREHFRKEYLEPLVKDGLIEPTIPNKPTSRLQRYRTTRKGQELLEQLT